MCSVVYFDITILDHVENITFTWSSIDVKVTGNPSIKSIKISLPCSNEKTITCSNEKRYYEMSKEEINTLFNKLTVYFWVIEHIKQPCSVKYFFLDHSNKFTFFQPIKSLG